MPQRIRKAVFPVGGLGTRFLPATKASPKEMLPIVDKPLIQYAVEEAIAAGCDELIFVTGRGKRAIADHFDVSYELEMELEAAGKHQRLQEIRDILPDNVTAVFIRQPRPLGLGHAVYCARRVVGNEPFAVLLADDLIDGGEYPCLSQMTDIFEEHQCSIIAVEEVERSETDKYGIVRVKSLDDRLGTVSQIVEKPAPEKAPSNLAVLGRYILTPRIFDLLEKTPRGAGGEIQLTDGIQSLLQEETVLAYEYIGKRYDCGSKLGYLAATVEYALKHAELGEGFREYLQSFCMPRNFP
jgi:UTP--glucose-1-phosphate uridylyltransferase